MKSYTDTKLITTITTSVLLAPVLTGLALPIIPRVEFSQNTTVISSVQELPKRYTNVITLYDKISENDYYQAFDSDVVTNDVNMTYEWLKDVDTSNWL